jgi:DNA-directed RNA polymerase specialized sigma24 family protein
MSDERAMLDSALAEYAAGRPGAPSGPAVRALIRYLVPVVQARVTAAVLARGRGRMLDDLRAYVADHTQDVLGRLFANDWEALRRWDAARGLTLRNWVGRVASMRMLDELRPAKHDPFRSTATPPESFAAVGGAGRPDQEVETGELWARVRDEVVGKESAQGRAMFELLVERDLSTVEVREATGLKDDAIFQWRRRLRLAVNQALAKLGGAP